MPRTGRGRPGTWRTLPRRRSGTESRFFYGYATVRSGTIFEASIDDFCIALLLENERWRKIKLLGLGGRVHEDVRKVIMEFVGRGTFCPSSRRGRSQFVERVLGSERTSGMA